MTLLKRYIELAGLQLKHVYARVSVNLRAQKLADLETVHTGKQKQDVYVADHSSTAKVILWEEQVGILHDKTSYKLENFVVREFGGTKYLSMGSESKVIPIEEIKDAKTVAKDYESMLKGLKLWLCHSLVATRHACVVEQEWSHRLTIHLEDVPYKIV